MNMRPSAALSATVVLQVCSLEASAQSNRKPIEVVNPAGETLAVEVNNFPATQSVEVNNLPETQSVEGDVNVLNFPASQTVDGSVSINNLPITQQVSGTVEVSNALSIAPAEGVSHLGIPLGEHQAYFRTGGPLLSDAGITHLARVPRTGGGGGDTDLDPGECLVLLDVNIAFRTFENSSPGTLGSWPNAFGYFEIGLTDFNGTEFTPFIDVVGYSDEYSRGSLQQAFAAGLVMAPSQAGDVSLDRLAIRTTAQTGAFGERYPYVSHATATGYVTSCP